MSTEPLNTVGYYGKIPARGDFVTKNLPRSFTEPWYAWVKEALACSKQQLESDWMDCYLTTPLYRYALSSGICGNDVWIGVMMASVDSVGRYFPLTICKSFPSHSNPLSLLDSNDDWFTQAESLLLSCLYDYFSLQSFEDAVTLLGRDVDSTITAKTVIIKHYDDVATQIPLADQEKQTVLYPTLIDQMAVSFYSSYSVWRTRGSDQVEPSFIFSDGLPPYKGVAAFMDGNWKKWGWDDEHVVKW